MGVITTAIAVVAAVGGAAASYESSRKQASVAKSTAKNQAEAQAAYEKEMAAANAKALAEEAKTKGKRIRARATRLTKQQRAQTAAAGLTLGEGTAEDITTETDILAQRDIDITKSDAERRGQLGIKQAAGRAPLLMQKAADIGKSAEAQAAGQQTGAIFRGIGGAAGAFEGYDGTTTDSDIVGTAGGDLGTRDYNLEGDYSIFNTSGF